MLDIWGVLLQTFTASGVAVILLAVKYLFKDKLPPKWHFAVWGVLAITLLLPAGWNGRYTLVHWQYVVELIKGFCKEYGFTRVLFPFPAFPAIPHTIADWVFVLYVAGVAVHLVNYLFAYIRLRGVLRKGSSVSKDIAERVKNIANDLSVKNYRVIEVTDLPSAFVCGIFRPILAVPAGIQLDDKILLHELMHLKSRDTIWSVVICILRSFHWCNPLLVHCADAAINDMEYRCDQFVLEQLEGEERRDYGHILLSMVNERFAQTPGTTCVNNGGKHIRERIETIARFKKYPAGMQLVSVCILLLLTISSIIGVQAKTLNDASHSDHLVKFASARSVPCTTYAGAFDAYGKAVLDQNGYYRVMCAPYAEQKVLNNELAEKSEKGIYPLWDSGIPSWPDGQEGYYVYNLRELEKNVYEGLMVFKLSYPPDGQPEEFGMQYLAVQNVRVENEAGRWVAIPTEAFRSVEATKQSLSWGCVELPGIWYTGMAESIMVETNVQTVYEMESLKQIDNGSLFFENSTFYDTTPQPNGKFTRAVRTHSDQLTHVGAEEERTHIQSVGVSIAPVYFGEDPPKTLTIPQGVNSTGGTNTGESWSRQTLELGWGPSVELSGGGGGSFDPKETPVFPAYYVADLYLNDTFVGRLEMHSEKGVA